MRLEEYSDIFEKTAVYPSQVDNFDLAYLYLGLLDELGELKEAINSGRALDVLDESGDCYWYMNGIVKWSVRPIVLDITYKEDPTRLKVASLEARTAAMNKLAEAILKLNKLAGKVKKYYRDGNTKILDLIGPSLGEVQQVVEYTHSIYGFSVEDVLGYNYNKLTGRKEADTLHGDNRQS